MIIRILSVAALMLAMTVNAYSDNVPRAIIAKVGTSVKATDGSLTITHSGKKQNYSAAQSMAQYRDTAILSPKSANIHPNGKKYYVNSLEGCKTVVYDLATHKRLKVINHTFGDKDSALWAPQSPLFRFTHYTNRDVRRFSGKPVESEFSHGGRYLWVPYYRRTFDINAQDPSAIAVIDTESDRIIRLFDTGPLPKMITRSNDGRTMAVTHWGNNTVGLINITSKDPKQWKYEACIPAPNELKLNFSLSHQINRDANSGLLLRGTVFTPDDKYLLVGEMGGGGIGVIDPKNKTYLGRLTGCSAPRHLVIRNGYLYLSSSSAGVVQRCALDSIVAAIGRLNNGRSVQVRGWETCRVGGGARTLELSPSGRFAFVACNSASRLCAVNTENMKMIAEIPCDSYPVGLAISADGKQVIVTSQARGAGGNAVNIYQVNYTEPEPVLKAPVEKAIEKEDSTAEMSGLRYLPNSKEQPTEFNTPMLIFSAAVLAILLVVWLFRRNKNKKTADNGL